MADSRTFSHARECKVSRAPEENPNAVAASVISRGGPENSNSVSSKVPQGRTCVAAPSEASSRRIAALIFSQPDSVLDNASPSHFDTQTSIRS